MTAIEVDSLTPKQRQAHDVESLRVLVTGGPGSGKTAVALLKARRVLEAEPAGSQRRVLFLSLTRSATAEVAGRVPHLLSGRLGERIEMATFHSFALNVLDGFRRYGGGGTAPVTLITEAEEKLGLGPVGGLKFDELLPGLLQLLDALPWVTELYASRYAAVMCDEFQDSTDQQVDLLERLTQSSRLICLADPYQEIYTAFVTGTRRDRIERFARSGDVNVIDLESDSSFRDPSLVIPKAAAAIREGYFGADEVYAALRQGRLRVVRTIGDDYFQALVDLIMGVQPRTSRTVGVFLRTNRLVTEFAQRLRDEGIEHEIIGLDAAAGEAQLAAAAILQYSVGEGDWSSVLRRLGLFDAACVRGQPEDRARALAHDPRRLPAGLQRRLEEARTTFESLAGRPLMDFLVAVRGFWGTIFTLRGQRLWERGIDDLLGSTLAYAASPASPQVAAAAARIAEGRRRYSNIDAFSAGSQPVRLMTTYQCKGREMDVAIVAHVPDERAPDVTQYDVASRVHFVNLTRARDTAIVLLPASPNEFYEPYLALLSP